MERLVSTIVLAFAVAGFAQAPVRDSRPLESDPTGIISGRVVAADTGEVIRKARVTINGSGPVAPTGSIGPSGPVPPPRADTQFRLSSPIPTVASSC